MQQRRKFGEIIGRNEYRGAVFYVAEVNDEFHLFRQIGENISHHRDFTIIVRRIGDHHEGDLRHVVDGNGKGLVELEEIVDRDDWSADNAMAFVFNGSGKRVAESFDGKAAAAPLLHIEYESTELTDIDLFF